MTVDPSSCPPIDIQDALDRLIATADVVGSRPAVDADLREDSILGAVLAAPILADRDHPPFDRATMDGYAIRAREANLPLTVEGSVAAGTPPPPQVSEGACVAIATGAAVPRGLDAVVEHDPELLVLSGLEEAVEELLSLWTAEAFALSDVDNDFFAEELSVALRACAPNGGALPEMFS